MIRVENVTGDVAREAATLDITGRTRLFAILADPVAHVRTPQGLNALAATGGYDGVMVPMEVAAGNLPAAVAGLRAMANLGGFVVTVPHKTAIVPLLDALSASAYQVGAVNVVRREADGTLTGQILDGIGFVAGLRAAGHELRGRSVHLAGAGGAARAIAFALAEAGVSRLTISNRTVERAAGLLTRLQASFPDLPLVLGTSDPTGHDIVVNTTSQGLREGDAPPVDVAALTPDQLVAEIIMVPAVTPLLAAATVAGCRTHPGLPMLRCQLALMAEWMGMARPDVTPP